MYDRHTKSYRFFLFKNGFSALLRYNWEIKFSDIYKKNIKNIMKQEKCRKYI